MPTFDDTPTDHKYITFPRQAFLEWIGLQSTQDLSRRNVAMIMGEIDDLTIHDSVVIRRQDFFASPALATYSACIALVASREQDPKTKAELLDVADYFQRQSELAAEEGFKLPDV